MYLVGAGPGDPELITIKGLDCLKSADVVIYDRLSSKALLSFCRPGTEFVFVGKAGGEYHPHPQSSINRLILEKAQEGGRVVRLKGGDPFVFGRGGEEALYLRRNGVEVEVVPGVSSAQGVPAYAGIPLTDRKLASSVALVTGHEDPQKFRSEVDWAKLATATGTVVIFMALKNLGFICDQFIEHGRPPDTPVALVRWGTLPEQQTIVGTLSDILSKAEAARLEPPVTIVVGEVVGLRDELKWFESQLLFGKKVVVTRAVEQIGEVSEAFRRRGAVVLEFPTIKIGPPPNYEAVDKALQEMASQGAKPAFDWLIFTSSNAVDWFFSRARERGHDARVFAHASIAAIGESTAER
ncbi:MAG: uroporphyrinogen-III C-methyltransferase, partial [Terriglobia bacterium]